MSGSVFWRRVYLMRWLKERPAHSGLTASQIVNVIGFGLYEGHGRYDRCFDDLKALERIGEVKRAAGRPARWEAR